MPTAFQEDVYKALEKIPKGSITTYGAIAKYLGTKAVRAVGTAVGKNPNAPQVPCHRGRVPSETSPTSVGRPVPCGPERAGSREAASKSR